MSGRINTMLDPVVPIMLAKILPTPRIREFKTGPPLADVRITIPPAMTKRDPSKIIKDRYSLSVSRIRAKSWEPTIQMVGRASPSETYP